MYMNSEEIFTFLNECVIGAEFNYMKTSSCPQWRNHREDSAVFIRTLKYVKPCSLRVKGDEAVSAYHKTMT